MELGYARVSTAKQDLDRQIEALAEAGLARERIYVDKKSGSDGRPARPACRAGRRDRRAYRLSKRALGGSHNQRNLVVNIMVIM